MPYRVIGSRIQLAGWATYGTMLWSFKTAMLVFYTRLTVRFRRIDFNIGRWLLTLLQSGLHKSYTNRIYIGFALLASTYIALMLTLFLTCRPFHKYWQINPNPGSKLSHRLLKRFAQFFLLTTDPCRCLPTRIVDSSHLDKPRPQRIYRHIPNIDSDSAVMEIRSQAFQKDCLNHSLYSRHLYCRLLSIKSTDNYTSTCFDPIIGRSAPVAIFLTSFQDPINGPQLAGAWGVRESFVATVTTSLPIIFPRLKHWFKAHLGSILSLRSTNKSDNTPTGFRTIGGGDGNPNGGVPQRRNPVPSVNHIPTKLTFTESEEQLVGGQVELRSLQKPGSSAQGSSSEFASSSH